MQTFLQFHLGDGVTVEAFRGPLYADPFDMMRLTLPSDEKIRSYATEVEEQRAKDWKAFLVYRSRFSQLDGKRKGEIFVDAETKRVLFSSYIQYP